MSLMSRGAESMSLDGGNVGIGIDYATEKLQVTGNIAVSGTVDGRDVAADGTKLDGIESGATADQTQSDINALAITQVGTISSGTWQGTAIASAYLDSDTAHLSGSQTFTGAKTFNSNVIIGGATYASYGSGSTDITGLISGSTFGSIQYGAGSGHHVIGVRDNDSGDSFAVISGTGNYNTDSTYDKLVFRAQANGQVIVGGNLDVASGIDVTGNITVTGTVDGVDIATRDAVLTSTTTTANAALPKAGGTMTGTLAMGANAITSTGTISSGAITVATAVNSTPLILGENTPSPWARISFHTFKSEAQANSLGSGSHIYTTNPSSGTESVFSEYGALVIQPRNDSNTGFAVRLGNGNGYGTAMFINQNKDTTFAGAISSGAITSSAGITAETGLNLESGTFVIKNGTGDSSGLRIFQDSSNASKIYNNYNGTLQLGVGNTTALTIDSSENATFAGTVTATGGNSTNWNTAYTVANAALPKAGGTMTGNIAHASNFTIDAGGDITLDADGGDVLLKDAGAAYGKLTNGSGSLHIVAQGADNDIKFYGNDGGSSVLALTLDMSNAGAATFNGAINSGTINSTGQSFLGNTTAITGTSTDATANVSYLGFYESDKTTRQGYIGYGSSGNTTLYITNDVASSEVIFRVGGGTRATITSAGNATFTGIVAATGGNSTNWNTAFGWGNHASAGYLTSYTDTNTTYSAGTGISLSGTAFSLTDTNAKLNLSGGTLTGALEITGNGDLLNLRAPVNGNIVRMTFSSNVPDTQVGHIQYTHGNTASYGSGEAFYIGGTESTTTILADGKLMFKEGIYLKPATGTGAGTRKDANWDTAYGWGNHASESYATQSYVGTAINNLIDGAPGTLNTLNELAAAVADNNTFFSTVLPKSGGAMTGPITTNSTFDGVDIATRDAVLTSTTTTANAALPKAGGTLTGTLTANAGIALGNTGISGVNALSFNDPGPNEGLSWTGGNTKIYESPDDLTTNSAGNLQFVYGSTRRFTVNSTGVDVNGALTATTKSFDIEHPSKKGMRLHHGVLEGPEHSVYVRGKSKEKVILLPDYWVDLVHEDTITVQLTAIGSEQDLYVEDIKDNKVFVNGDNYFYYVQAERKDVDRFEVEYESNL